MSIRKPTLCVVAGPNGSGKTTTTVQLLNDEWTADLGLCFYRNRNLVIKQCQPHDWHCF